MVRFHPTYHMLIPHLSVGTYVVVFKLIRLLDASFVYLILWLAFLFVPWWYRCHILSIRCRDRCWVIEFVLLDTGSLLWLFLAFIQRMNIILFFKYCWFVTSWCGYLIPHLHTPIEFWHPLVSVFSMILVWSVYEWVFKFIVWFAMYLRECSLVWDSFGGYFDYVILLCFSHPIKGLC